MRMHMRICMSNKCNLCNFYPQDLAEVVDLPLVMKRRKLRNKLYILWKNGEEKCN